MAAAGDSLFPARDQFCDSGDGSWFYYGRWRAGSQGGIGEEMVVDRSVRLLRARLFWEQAGILFSWGWG